MALDIGTDWGLKMKPCGLRVPEQFLGGNLRQVRKQESEEVDEFRLSSSRGLPQKRWVL